MRARAHTAIRCKEKSNEITEVSVCPYELELLMPVVYAMAASTSGILARGKLGQKSKVVCLMLRCGTLLTDAGGDGKFQLCSNFHTVTQHIGAWKGSRSCIPTVLQQATGSHIKMLASSMPMQETVNDGPRKSRQPLIASLKATRVSPDALKRGFCVPKGLCNTGSEFLCDKKNEVCCPYDPLSKTKCSPLCPTTQPCIDNYGYCTIPENCYEKIVPEWCEGESCVCCAPVCPSTQPCIDNYGYCTIPENCYEKIVPEWCEGESCVCCAPVCPTTQLCIDNYGYCTIPENCYEKIVPEWCEGESCICCAPVCPSTQQCQEAYGYCSSPESCYGKYVPEWCDGEDCVCCIQDCFPNPECLNVNGYCTSPDTCSGNIVPEWCGGEMCVCCVPDDCNIIPPPKECIDNYAGVCQKDCEDGRIPTGFCFGDCQCCGCPTTDECKANLGYCTESLDTCNGINNPELCPGEKCTCCMPATVTAVTIIEPCETPVDCQSARGYCNQTCPPWLYPDPNLCPDGCYCCLGEYELAPLYH
ncbi:protein psiR-like [Macrobrachium nipponense]|uniref:protein psiR-like n=1 Tax=Macrobrachium nipponense TaxID=159736 RepID=UPI0030C83257